MSIRHRPMRPQDVRECVEIIAAHPTVGPRYGDAISDLRPSWLHLLSSNGFCATSIIEEVDGTRSRILGIGASVFVSDDFVRELKTPPSFWIGPELAKRVSRGDDSALLSPKQTQDANSRGGLNLAVWQGLVLPEDARRADLWSKLTAVFLDDHRGFLLKEIVSQGESPEHLEALRSVGGFLINGRNSCYGDFNGVNAHQLAGEPHIIGITRELALRQFGSWISTLFRYEPPQFRFSRSEQRLLLSAMAGGTDEELAGQLSVSLSTVKKTWLSVYDRVAACRPELVPRNASAHGDISTRGRDKKQHLIAYLREHPEELRPTSRKLLRQSPAPARSSSKGR